jgi:hypothetical protein
LEFVRDWGIYPEAGYARPVSNLLFLVFLQLPLLSYAHISCISISFNPNSCCLVVNSSEIIPLNNYQFTIGHIHIHKDCNGEGNPKNIYGYSLSTLSYKFQEQ